MLADIGTAPSLKPISSVGEVQGGLQSLSQS